jgi:hypothetical protein
MNRPKSDPVHQGCSVGEIMIAAGAGVRHVDEWEAAWHLVPGPAVRDIPAEALDVVSNGGGFERLAASIFSFVRNVALRLPARALTKDGPLK